VLAMLAAKRIVRARHSAAVVSILKDGHGNENQGRGSAATNFTSRESSRVSEPACEITGLSQRREGGWRQNLIADARNNRSIAFALVAYLVPSRVV